MSHNRPSHKGSLTKLLSYVPHIHASEAQGTIATVMRRGTPQEPEIPVPKSKVVKSSARAESLDVTAESLLHHVGSPSTSGGEKKDGARMEEHFRDCSCAS
jgi:hypothetical protein